MKKLLTFVPKILFVLLLSTTTVFGMRSVGSIDPIFGFIDPNRCPAFIKENTSVEEIGRGADKIVYKIDTNEALVWFFKTRYFDHEVSVLRKLDHENIIKIRNINEGHCSFVQDLAAMDLFDFVDSVIEGSSGLSKREIQKQFLKILRDVASALNYLHQRNIVHRDIKPENILLFGDVYGDYTAKLTDFSYSIQMPPGEEVVECNKLSGSLIYTSPESLGEYIIENRGTLYHCRCTDDIYAFAMVAYFVFYQFSVYNFYKEIYMYRHNYEKYPTFFHFYAHMFCNGTRPYLGDESVFLSINSLIERCWDVKYEDRPLASEIIETLDIFLLRYNLKL